MKRAFILCSTLFFISMAACLLYALNFKTYPYFTEITLGESVRTVAILVAMSIFGMAALFAKD